MNLLLLILQKMKKAPYVCLFYWVDISSINCSKFIYDKKGWYYLFQLGRSSSNLLEVRISAHLASSILSWETNMSPRPKGYKWKISTNMIEILNNCFQIILPRVLFSTYFKCSFFKKIATTPNSFVLRLRIAGKLSQNCPKVIPKLSQSSLKIVPMLSQKCPKVVSKLSQSYP